MNHTQPSTSTVWVEMSNTIIPYLPTILHKNSIMMILLLCPSFLKNPSTLISCLKDPLIGKLPPSRKYHALKISRGWKNIEANNLVLPCFKIKNPSLSRSQDSKVLFPDCLLINISKTILTGNFQQNIRATMKRPTSNLSSMKYT